uniref:F-box domain-containing protein n=1 Tax=Setaria viridis TaxID=4556 RepID=A0A4U6WSH5_SETVI|nr:hypothetical protein SEVIR_1G363200v2 [Setaria viridis]
MVHDPVDIVEAEIGKISELPGDVLLDILGRLVEAGDVRAVRPLGRRVVVWQHVRRRRQRVWQQDQHRATAGLTDALARFLAAPPSKRVIERLSLKFILTRRDYVRRIGELVGAAAGTGTVKNIEVELVSPRWRASRPTKRSGPSSATASASGTSCMQDCPGAFRSLTKLTLQDLWFHDMAELNGLVRGCDALLFLSLSSCALLPPIGDEPPQRPPLAIDAPDVELVQAPELVALRYRAIVVEDSPPVSFGCTPSLKGLYLGHYQDEGSFAKLKLSELLVNGGGQLEVLFLAFENGKERTLCAPTIWLQPEHLKQLRAALRGLKNLTLTDISPGCNLSWTTFLLEAAPFLDTLDIMICNHICMDSWHKKGDEDANLEWELEPSSDFRHHHLKQLSFKRAFHVEKDLPSARLVMGLALNLQAVTLGVKSLGCAGCIDAQRKYPDFGQIKIEVF